MIRIIIWSIAVLGVNPVSAEVLKAENAVAAAQYQPPLYYEYNLKGPMTMETDIIPAQGTIQSICAFWDFEGQVRMEASATAGSSYIPIVNGQILKEGFLPGNQLRLRINIGEDSLLKAIVLGYADSSGTSRLFRNQELSGFKYHKILRVEGGDRELFNYPVKIELGSLLEEVKPDFSDIRFCASDSQIPLSYYSETNSPDRRDIPVPPLSGQGAMGGGLFWVKIPQIPKEGIDIHLYYGNPEAKDASNPQDVFLFYDDFSAKTINQAKWTLSCGFDKKPELTNGELKLDGCSLSSSVFQMKEGVLEFKARSEGQSAIQAVVHGEKRQDSGYLQEEMVYSSSYPGAEHTIAVNDVAKLNAGVPIKPGESYIYKAIVAKNGIIFERYSRDYQKEAEIRFLDTPHQNKGYIGLKGDTSLFRQGSSYFDWIRVRPYAEVEPRIQTGRASK